MITAPAVPRIVTLRLDYPPLALQPNGRPGHFAKARSKAQYRRDAFILARQAQNDRAQAIGRTPLRAPVTADVEFVVKTAARRDGDNLGASLKSAWDGIVDAGLLEDDSTEHLCINPPRVVVRVVKVPYVVVTLTEAGA